MSFRNQDLVSLLADINDLIDHSNEISEEEKTALRNLLDSQWNISTATEKQKKLNLEAALLKMLQHRNAEGIDENSNMSAFLKRLISEEDMKFSASSSESSDKSYSSASPRSSPETSETKKPSSQRHEINFKDMDAYYEATKKAIESINNLQNKEKIIKDIDSHYEEYKKWRITSDSKEKSDIKKSLQSLVRDSNTPPLVKNFLSVLLNKINEKKSSNIFETSITMLGRGASSLGSSASYVVQNSASRIYGAGKSSIKLAGQLFSRRSKESENVATSAPTIAGNAHNVRSDEMIATTASQLIQDFNHAQNKQDFVESLKSYASWNMEEVGKLANAVYDELQQQNRTPVFFNMIESFLKSPQNQDKGFAMFRVSDGPKEVPIRKFTNTFITTELKKEVNLEADYTLPAHLQEHLKHWIPFYAEANQVTKDSAPRYLATLLFFPGEVVDSNPFFDKACSALKEALPGIQLHHQASPPTP